MGWNNPRIGISDRTMVVAVPYVGYCKQYAAHCPGPEPCPPNTCNRNEAAGENPFATFEPTICQECDNEVEGVCSACDARICGSCFNGRHEYRPHGLAYMSSLGLVECPDCGLNHPYPCTDGTCDCCIAIERSGDTNG